MGLMEPERVFYGMERRDAITGGSKSLKPGCWRSRWMRWLRRRWGCGSRAVAPGELRGCGGRRCGVPRCARSDTTRNTNLEEQATQGREHGCRRALLQVR